MKSISSLSNSAIAALLFLSPKALAATLWSGNFDYYNTVSDFDTWSWSNQVGEYQWYIHGSQPTSHYLALDSSYKNPAITNESKGLKLTIDSTATWNGQTMWRTELIPQTTSNLGTGQTYYHFTLAKSTTNAPSSSFEHQIVFFESHFTELKLGVGSNPSQLQWFVSGSSKWSVDFVAGTYYNFAYDINFSAGTVGLWFSTGCSPLQRVAANVAASTSTNSADWHLGVLAFGSGSVVEDWYFSGVYIESSTLTTTIGSCSGGSSSSAAGSSSAGVSSSSKASSVSSTATSTSSAATATQTKYGQCGGTGWTGPTVCASGSTCTAISAPWYYQCL